MVRGKERIRPLGDKSANDNRAYPADNNKHDRYRPAVGTRRKVRRADEFVRAVYRGDKFADTAAAYPVGVLCTYERFSLLVGEYVFLNKPHRKDKLDDRAAVVCVYGGGKLHGGDIYRHAARADN